MEYRTISNAAFSYGIEQMKRGRPGAVWIAISKAADEIRNEARYSACLWPESAPLPIRRQVEDYLTKRAGK